MTYDVQTIALPLTLIDELVAAAAVFLSPDTTYAPGSVTRAQQRRRLEAALVAVDICVDRAVLAAAMGAAPSPPHEQDKICPLS
jgi:hypothetical protein